MRWLQDASRSDAPRDGSGLDLPLPPLRLAIAAASAATDAANTSDINIEPVPAPAHSHQPADHIDTSDAADMSSPAPSSGPSDHDAAEITSPAPSGNAAAPEAINSPATSVECTEEWSASLITGATGAGAHDEADEDEVTQEAPPTTLNDVLIDPLLQKICKDKNSHRGGWYVLLHTCF